MRSPGRLRRRRTRRRRPGGEGRQSCDAVGVDGGDGPVGAQPDRTQPPRFVYIGLGLEMDQRGKRTVALLLEAPAEVVVRTPTCSSRSDQAGSPAMAPSSTGLVIVTVSGRPSSGSQSVANRGWSSTSGLTICFSGCRPHTAPSWASHAEPVLGRDEEAGSFASRRDVRPVRRSPDLSTGRFQRGRHDGHRDVNVVEHVDRVGGSDGNVYQAAVVKGRWKRSRAGDLSAQIEEHDISSGDIGRPQRVVRTSPERRDVVDIERIDVERDSCIFAEGGGVKFAVR